MDILNKLLSQNNNKWQIIGAVIGSFMGLLLLLLSLQLFQDLRSLTSGNGGGSDQFVILNKKVDVISFGGVVFDKEDIEKIKNQPFVKKVGEFTSNNFKASAGIARFGFSTELFFESIPTEFIDVDTSDFFWEVGQNQIPIIISKDYLALYNFGFAPSQGLPAVNAGAIKSVPLDITIRGNGMRKNFKGQIVGLSNRINSIMAPQSFMKYANNTFPENKPKASSRIMVLASNPYSDTFTKFLEDNGYEISSGRVIGGQVASMLKGLITAVAFIGLLIVLLSVLVFILNFQLIVSKSSENIRLLLQLGYKQSHISSILKKYLTKLFAIIFGLTLVFLFIIRYFIVSYSDSQGLELASGFHPLVLVAAVLFIGLSIFINYKNIDKSILNLSS